MINIKPVQYVVRKYSKGSYEEKSAYDGVMTMIHISDKLCFIYGAKGEFNKVDYSDIGVQLEKMGYEEVLIERHNRVKKIKVKDFIIESIS